MKRIFDKSKSLGYQKKQIEAETKSGPDQIEPARASRASQRSPPPQRLAYPRLNFLSAPSPSQRRSHFSHQKMEDTLTSACPIPLSFCSAFLFSQKLETLGKLHQPTRTHPPPHTHTHARTHARTRTHTSFFKNYLEKNLNKAEFFYY